MQLNDQQLKLAETNDLLQKRNRDFTQLQNKLQEKFKSENVDLVEKVKDLTAQNEFYRLKNSVQSTDRKPKYETDNQLADFIQVFKTTKHDIYKSEEMLLKLISDLETDKKTLQADLQNSNAQNKIIELQLSKLQQEQHQN